MYGAVLDPGRFTAHWSPWVSLEDIGSNSANDIS